MNREVKDVMLFKGGEVLYYIERCIRNFVQVLETTYYPRNVYSKISTISVKVLKEAKFLAKYQSKR